MKVRWIIENFVGDNGYEDLIAEVKKQGMECYVLDIRNHFELSNRIIDLGDVPMVFQGSIQMFKKLREELVAAPLGWMTDENYLCSNYYPHFQKYLFNDKHVFTTVAGLKHNKWWFYTTFGKEASIYVRPDSGNKTFKGQLLDLQDFDRFWGNKISCDVKDTDLVVVSTPKNIIWEGRFIVTKYKEILGCSTYVFQGQLTYVPSAPTQATELVKELLEVGYYPDPVFTIDICQDSDNNFWLMEMNSFTSAGTYAAKKDLIVKRVSEIAMSYYHD